MILSQSFKTTTLLLNNVQIRGFREQQHNRAGENHYFHPLFSSVEKYTSCNGRTVNLDPKN